jgi:hypothetical protein
MSLPTDGVAGCALWVDDYADWVAACALRMDDYADWVAGCANRLSVWLCKSVWKDGYESGWIACIAHYLKGCQCEPTECLANDCWSDWTLFEWTATLNDRVDGYATGLVGSASRLNLWLRTLFECLTVPTKYVAGCAYCWKVLQCQSSEWLAAHVAWMDDSRLSRGWVCTLHGCYSLSGWLCQLAERPPVPTGRIEIPVSDFEHTLHEPARTSLCRTTCTR